MKPPRSAVGDPQGALFQSELAHLIESRHPLAQLAGEIDWAAFDEAFGIAYADSNVGRPPAPTRLLVALHYLKYTFDLSDENVILRWFENPYWQSYVRVGKQTLLMQSRYAHAKQFKRARKATRRLKTFLGRVIRDVERKAINPSPELKNLLALSKRLHAQKRTD